MKRLTHLILSVTLLLTALNVNSGARLVSADGTAQTPPYSQAWTNIGLITANDDWSGVPGIIGYRGDDITTATGADPQTLLADGTTTPVDVNANQTNPVSFTTGGVTEFHLTDPVVALAGSGTADAPFILLNLNTTSLQSIQVSYNLRDLDSSADNAVQPVALHYRVGNTGNFTNVPAAYVSDATAANAATLVTPVNVTLPAGADNQSLVQIRWMSVNASGNDEWVGIDDISVTGSPFADAAPSVSSTSPADNATDVLLDANITIDFSEAVDAANGWFSISCTSSGSHTATVSGGPQSYTLNPDSDFALNETCTVTVDDAFVTDQDANDPPNNMAADYVFDFTTVVVDPAPTVSSTTPANGATNVAIGANLTVNFSENVDVTGNWFTISCANSGSHTATVSGGPQSYTLNPNSDFAYSELCTATIVASQVSDQDALDPDDTMASNYVWTFTTTAPPTLIRTIQGQSHVSPLDGQAVTSVNGIVTAVRSNGFYMQDPAPDNNVGTSEGIFVFTNSAPTVSVGDDVTVSGTVDEYRPANDNLSITQIAGPTIQVNSQGNSLPGPMIIGVGGRVPPTMVIEDDSSGSVETTGTYEPTMDGIDFYESLEGMRVQVNNAVAVGPTNDFGEIPVLGDSGTKASGRATRGSIIIRSNDYNPERIFIDDVFVSTPDVHVGATFPGAIVGVMDYSFDNYKLLATTLPSVVASTLTRETTDPVSGPSELSVATFNVENLSPNDSATKFNTLASLIVNNMRAPDIIGLEEVQDNNGATNDSVVSASTTASMLISAIQAAGGPTYQYRDIAPADDQDGGQPGGNIRVAFLYRTDRGVSFISRAGGTATAATTVVSGPSGPELSFSPGRVDPNNVAWAATRKPLVGEFMFKGRKLFVIVNHFSSKGGDEPLYGVNQPPTLTTEAKRIQQAQAVNSFVDQILAVDPNANIVVVGDINDFQFSPTMTALTDGGVLNPMIDTLPQSERYSYIFEGNSQALDHILVSDNLFNNAAPEYDVVHVNAEFHDQASDHDPSLVRLTFAPLNLVSDSDLSVQYDGWRGGTDGAITYRATMTASQMLSHRLPGASRASSITLRLYHGPDQGIARIRINGNKVITYTDLYTTTPQWIDHTFTAAVPNDYYMVELMATGQKNAASSGTEVRLDYILYDGNTVEVTDPAIRYNNWQTTNERTNAYGGLLYMNRIAGSSVKYTFTGTEVTWYMSLGNYFGKADVYIDGAFVRTVDQYSASKINRYGEFFGGLTAGTHTIEIRVRADRNAASTNNYITVDGFESY
jgi:predicted extracellular nuclease